MKTAGTFFLILCLTLIISGAWADTGIFKGNNERTGDYSTDMGPGMSNGKVLWKKYIGPGLTYHYYQTPVIANGVMYIVDRDDKSIIHAMGATNGTILWTYYCDNYIWDELTVADGVIYFGTYHGPVYAVNAVTGLKIWEAGIDPDMAFGYPTSAISSPLVDGNYVYFQDWYGWIYKFNKANGARVAKIETGNRYNVISEGITYQVKAGHYGSPALSNGVLYTGCRDISFVWLWPESSMTEDYVCAVTTSGTPVWKSTNGHDWGHWYTSSTPAIAGNRVFMSSGNGNITAFDKDSGSHLWNFVGGWYTFGEPVIANGTVYVTSVVREPDDKYFGRIYALNAANGAQLWSHDVDDRKAWWNNAPVYANNVLYATYSWSDSTKPPYPKSYSSVAAINALTGEEIWNFSYDYWVGSPVVADGVVYFSSEDGYLFALGNATADTLPVPDFDADATIGVSPMTVHFTDLSRSNGTLYRNWSFGDGNWTNSTGQAPVNPTFTYHTPGYYWVELSVTNSSGTNTTTRASYIHVLDEAFTFAGPEITKINITPKAPTTLHNVKFKAEYMPVGGYEVIGYDWVVLDAVTGKTDWSLSKNENPATYKPAAGRYKNKVVQCTMTYKETATGQLGFSYASQPFKMYFEMGNRSKWADDDADKLPNWYEYWKADNTIDGIGNFRYTNAKEAGEYVAGNDTLYLGPDAPKTWIAFTLNTPNGTEHFGGLVGINNTAATILHESNHKRLTDLWKPGGAFNGLADSDEGWSHGDEDDDLPDTYESTVSKTWNNQTDTYNLSTVLADGYWTYGDQEYMCYRAEWNYTTATHKDRDWANPGLQAGPEGVVNISSVGGGAGSMGVLAFSLGKEPLAGNTNAAGDSDSVLDTNGNGLYNHLIVSTTVNITRNGTYYVEGILLDSSGNVIAETGNDTSFDKGMHPVSLDFDGNEIYRSGVNGLYNVSLVLWETSRESFIKERRPDFLQTNLYYYTDFEGAQASFTGSWSDEGVDTNGDGTDDYLRVQRDITVSSPGNYRVEGYLETGNESAVIFSETYPTSAVGTTPVTLDFSGDAIGQSRKNGPYNITLVVLYDNDEELQVIPDPYRTSAYSYTDFIRSPVSVGSTFRDWPVDSDANGVNESLAIETSVTADTPGTYVITGVLADETGETIGYAANMTTLPAGANTVTLLFAGGDIYRHAVSGTYSLEQVRASPKELTDPDQIANGYTTTLYDYTTFIKPAPLEARFDAYPLKGAPPLVVDFTDRSVGSPKEYNWSFGDGTVSTMRNPVHVYESEGLYPVRLTVANAFGSNYSEKSSFINVTIHQGPLIAQFFANVTKGVAPLVVQFRDTSEGEPTWWMWDIDGTPYMEKSPVHTFTTPGNYSVTMTAGRSGGANTTPIMYFTVLPAGTLPVKTQFTANETRGAVPFAVQFMDTSTGSPTEWNWSFGDGAVSAEKNPVHTYYTAGSYTVSLKATNAYTSSTLTTDAYITVDIDPAAGPLRVIPPGGTVFIGESGLNLTRCAGTNNTLAWWASPAQVGVAPPMKVVHISGQERDFFVSQAEFGGYTGTWYTSDVDNPAGIPPTAFIAAEPAIDITVTDATTGTDANGMTIPVGDQIAFTITSNLDVLTERGIAGAPVRIWIQGPDGTVYTSLVNKTGTATSLYREVSGTPHATGTIWNTANGLYPAGNYTITAWSTANHMNTNYPVSGRTIAEYRFVNTSTSPPPVKPAPAVSGITPASAYLESTVNFSITGSNFINGSTTVEFRNQTTILSPVLTNVSANRIDGYLIVPATSATGPWNVRVVVTGNGENTLIGKFSLVQLMQPTVTSITPSYSGRTAVVKYTIAGTNFQTGAGNTAVTLFNRTHFDAGNPNITANITSITPTSITGNFTVPADSPFGAAWAVNVTTVSGGMSTSPVYFSVTRQNTPTVATVTPNSGVLNSTVPVALTGTNFQVGVNGTYVTFFNKTYADAHGGDKLVLSVKSVTATSIKGLLVIPADATVGNRWNVTVATVDGGNSTSSIWFTVIKPVPTIASITPSSGVRTNRVVFTLTGTNFQPGTGNTTVTLFNRTHFEAGHANITANITSLTPTSITGNFTVPADSPFGAAWAVNVTTATGGMSMSPILFSVPQQKTPTINAITPASGMLNSTVPVTLTGTNFQVGVNGTYVTFFNKTYADAHGGDNLVLAVTSVTTTSIKGNLVIPADATVGNRWNVTVTTVDGGNSTSSIWFTAIKPVPTIASLTPTSGVRTNIITFTLAGTNFQPGIGNTTVTLFNRTFFDDNNRNITANITSLTPTAIVGNFTVPADSPFGAAWSVNVTTATGGMSMSPILFSVPQQKTPTVTAITPASAFRNSTVLMTVTGTNFQIGTTGSNVTLYNKTYFDATGEKPGMTILKLSPTQIIGYFRIADTAVEGNQWLLNVTTVDGGMSMSIVKFTVNRPVPTITTMTPTSGVRTSIVKFTIAGTNFQPGVGNTTVTLFNRTFFDANNKNITANITKITPTSITGNFTVPADSPFGAAWVINVTTASGGMSMSPIMFSVPQQKTPTVTAITPISVFRNGSVLATITGTNFQVGVNGTYVTLYNKTYFDATGENIVVTVLKVTPTSIIGRFQVPDTAPDGNQWVVNATTVDGGTSPSAVRFTVVKPVPTITSITPASGVRTNIITFTIAGTNFQPGVGNTTVTLFNRTYFDTYNQNLTANITAITPTAIIGNFTVPADSPFGAAWAVNVTTANGGMSMSPIMFSVTPQKTPAITTVMPAAGVQNSTADLTITGTNFQVGTAGSAVTIFNQSYYTTTTTNLTVVLKSVTATTIKCRVTIPQDAPEGDGWRINVTTVDGGSSTSLVKFTVIRPTPAITSITPTSGARASVVTYTITGTNFQTGLGNTTVTLYNSTYFATMNKNVTANVTTVTPTTIKGNFTVPDDADFGNLWFVNVTTTNGGSSISRVIFTENRLVPSITTMTPDTGYPTSTVSYTITGTNFQPGMTTINLSKAGYGEVTTAIYSLSPTRIQGGIQIPADAPAGAWKVNVSTTDGGTRTWARTFTVSKMPAPVISTIAPTAMYRGTTVSFTVNGNYFQPGGNTVMNLTNSSGYNITATLSSVYPTSISGTVTLPDEVKPGAWKVNVTTTDGGTGTKINAVTIL